MQPKPICAAIFVGLSTIAIFANTAGTVGGGVYNDDVFGPVQLRNTIIARNTATSDVDVSGVQFSSQGNNLIGDRGSVTMARTIELA